MVVRIIKSDYFKRLLEKSSEDRILLDIGKEFVEIDGVKYKNSRVIAFEGKVYIVSKNAQFVINVTRHCNADCGFCSNKLTFVGDDGYLKLGPQFEKALRFASLAQAKEAVLTGGEPTLLREKLIDILIKVKSKFEKVWMHSNGLNLWTEVEYNGKKDFLIKILKEYGLSGISLSIAHWDPKVNASIMNLKGEYKGLTATQLKKLANLMDNDFSVRLSCILLSDLGVGSLESIREYIRWGENSGFRRFIFRGSFTVPTEFARMVVVSWKKGEELIKEMGKKASLWGWKVVWSLEKSDMLAFCLETKEGARIMLESGKEEVDPDKKIRRIIVWPIAGDGRVFVSWIDPLDVLFEEDVKFGIKLLERDLPWRLKHGEIKWKDRSLC